MGIIDAAFEFVSTVVKVRAPVAGAGSGTVAAERSTLKLGFPTTPEGLPGRAERHSNFGGSRSPLCLTQLGPPVTIDYLCLATHIPPTLRTQMGDGSYLSIQTDKPMYYAGETVTGKVVASIISPKQADRVVVKVSGKEVVEWDEERSETIFEGEGENRRSQTIWHHHERKAKHKLFKDVIIVSQLPHILQPGTWEYPFSYTLRQDLPGCLKFKSHTPSGDPSWRNAGRHNDVKAKIVYSFKAAMQNGQLFSRDIKGCQEVVVRGSGRAGGGRAAV